MPPGNPDPTAIESSFHMNPYVADPQQMDQRVAYLEDQLHQLQQQQQQQNAQGTLAPPLPIASILTRPRSRKRKRNNDPQRVISRTLDDLTADENEIREYLMKCVRQEFGERTGTQKVAMRGSNSNEESQDEESSHPIAANMRYQWDEDIHYMHNARIIQHIAQLVFQAQSNQETRTLPHTATTVQFTQHDVLSLVKGQMQLRRMLRKRKLKEHRLHGVPQYIKDHGCDPTPFLRTPWMSEENSECSFSDEDERAEHQISLAKKSGLTTDEINSGTKVLERLSLRWRSQKMNQLITELDQYRVLYYVNQGKSVPGTVFRRVSIGRVRDDPPDTHNHAELYPFMLSRTWMSNHPEHPTLSLGNPSGFSDSESNVEILTSPSAHAFVLTAPNADLSSDPQSGPQIQSAPNSQGYQQPSTSQNTPLQPLSPPSTVISLLPESGSSLPAMTQSSHLVAQPTNLLLSASPQSSTQPPLAESSERFSLSSSQPSEPFSQSFSPF
ncbi:hypothetical protein BDW22DRAFT_1433297 [Trametopsis cervina]|nr:hypothetical protein BDW22DRAFT_1433297 [Trametopsis cervina]